MNILLKEKEVHTIQVLYLARNEFISFVNFRDILYYSVHKDGTDKSYEIINAHLKMKNILDVSNTSLIKRRNNADLNYFETINKELLNYIYSDNKPRTIAVDGSKINLLKCNGKDDGFKLSKNKSYCTALISSLYDVNKKIPINYGIYNSSNERAVLLDQLNYCKKNDTLIMDRGYFSIKLLNEFIEREFNFIFRMRNSSKFVKELNKKGLDNMIFDYEKNKDKTIKLKIVKYKINKEYYYLLTKFTKKEYGVNKLKELYKKRWLVETDFLYSKKYLTLDKIKYKKSRTIKQSIKIHNFIQIIVGYIEYLMNNCNNKYKINKRTSIDLFNNNLLYLLFYKKANKKAKNKITKILTIIENSLILIEEGRHYSRIRKLPSSKWCLNAIKFIYKYKSKKK